MLSGLSAEQRALFAQGREEFMESEGIGEGLGPRFNLDSCAGCHAHPAVGGTSPSTNPQVALAQAKGADNTVPSFVQADGPIVEVRFKSDDAVHALFVISKRVDDTGDAGFCRIEQESFPPEQVRRRIPTPVFGLGLVEQIDDDTIVAQQGQDQSRKTDLGIGGTPQQKVNGRIGRFGWKAQHGSLEAFAGEAYNVEMGITNELSPKERETDPLCQFAPVPNSLPEEGEPSPVELFAVFMQGLAPPTPSTSTPGGPASIRRGAAMFAEIGCALCHTPSLAGVPLYSDLLLHHMGSKLDEGITQRKAGGDEFRTAPLWGLGQRLFFLHDGRTTDLLQAIRDHDSSGSEAKGVMKNFDELDTADVQDLLNFLRSL